MKTSQQPGVIRIEVRTMISQ